MSTIDAKNLKHLIWAAKVCRASGADVLKIADFWPLVDAAEAHLATLPREHTYTAWMVVDSYCGDGVETYDFESDAIEFAKSAEHLIVVPLTGTVTLPPRKP